MNKINTHNITINNKFLNKTANNFKTTILNRSNNSIQSFSKESAAGLKSYALAFTGKDIVEDVVKNIKGKNYQGQGLYSKDDNGEYTDYIDWKDKIGWEKLVNEQLDWTKASNEEVYGFLHALSLAEANDTPWTRRFNPLNVTEPLATYRTLAATSSKKMYAGYLNELSKITSSELSFLDKSAINPETGDINFAFTVFDTETTGVNIVKKPTIPGMEPRAQKPLDKIVQIGAVKYDAKGQIIPDSALDQILDPEMPIPAGASNVHRIFDEDVKGKPKMGELLESFMDDYLKNEVVVAYNSKFDMTILKNAVEDYNEEKQTSMEPKKSCTVIDPFILIQRIHPYIGAKKQLSEQYKFLFGQNVDGAHDAFADVVATVDVLKYCMHYLNNEAKKNGKTLTVRDILKFQWGENIDGIGIKLNNRGVNADKRFKKSYRQEIVGVSNYPVGYCIAEPTKKDSDTPNVIAKIADKIGDKNVEILRNGSLINKEVEDQEALEDAEKEQQPLTNKSYVTRRYFKEILENAGIDSNGKLSRAEVIDLILDNSKKFIKEDYVDLWVKNVDPDTVSKGNDMPDIDISRRVMLEKLDTNKKVEGKKARELKEVV